MPNQVTLLAKILRPKASYQKGQVYFEICQLGKKQDAYIWWMKKGKTEASVPGKIQ